MAFDRGNRTYYVSDERLKAFRALSVEEKLRWQEEFAAFILLTRASSQNSNLAEKVYGCLDNIDTDKAIDSLRGKVE